MPNDNDRFNPAYSTIKAIYLANRAGIEGSGNNAEKLNIARFNTECVFEKIEFVENINDVLPNGVLVVRDINDIVSRMRKYEIENIVIEFFEDLSWEPWTLDITSISYINNAASDTEENFVNIYFSNKYYKKSQNSSLINVLDYKQPVVFLITTFVNLVKNLFFETQKGFVSQTDNYVLYRPINTVNDRIEAVSTNPLEYLNYLASSTVNRVDKLPQFMFWTDFDGSVNFKFFNRDCTKDNSFNLIDAEVRRIAIFDGDSVIQKLSDDKVYRKCYFYNTNPAYQFISKKYHYIKKTPKILDTTPSTLSGESLDSYLYSGLMYQFQDEGQKYNIEVVGVRGTTFAVPGSDQLYCKTHWGYYDGLESIDSVDRISSLGGDFGNSKNYNSLTLMGSSGYMPFVDTTEMWKNMFDITEIHPHYPDQLSVAVGFAGEYTNLQKIMNVRYNSFLQTIANQNDRLTQLRNIELQNFIMYTLCCMGKKREESFFAVLTKFEVDSSSTQPNNPSGKIYRYRWNKLKFNSKYDENGPVGLTGYYFNEIEKWSLDSEKSSTNQDDTWAINTNERGLSAGYLPPGWVYQPPTGFYLRPIGLKTDSFDPILNTSGDIFHIVKMYKIPLEELLLKSNNNLYREYAGKYLYYFSAENVLDGRC